MGSLTTARHRGRSRHRRGSLTSHGRCGRAPRGWSAAGARTGGVRGAEPADVLRDRVPGGTQRGEDLFVDLLDVDPLPEPGRVVGLGRHQLVVPAEVQPHQVQDPGEGRGAGTVHADQKDPHDAVLPRSPQCSGCLPAGRGVRPLSRSRSRDSRGRGICPDAPSETRDPPPGRTGPFRTPIGFRPIGTRRAGPAVQLEAVVPVERAGQADRDPAPRVTVDRLHRVAADPLHEGPLAVAGDLEPQLEGLQVAAAPVEHLDLDQDLAEPTEPLGGGPRDLDAARAVLVGRGSGRARRLRRRRREGWAVAVGGGDSSQSESWRTTTGPGRWGKGAVTHGGWCGGRPRRPRSLAAAEGAWGSAVAGARRRRTRRRRPPARRGAAGRRAAGSRVGPRRGGRAAERSHASIADGDPLFWPFLTRCGMKDTVDLAHHRTAAAGCGAGG